MSYPVGWDLVNITGTYVGRNGVPCVGSVTLSSPQLVLRSGTIVPAADIVFDLVNGTFSGQIPATDDPNAQPSGWVYTVTENVPGGRQGYQIAAPHTSPGIDLSTVVPVTMPQPPNYGFPYVTLAQLAGTAVGDGAYLIGYQNPATGSVARTVQARLQDVVSVKDFGAKGDGTTDDTTAFLACISSLQLSADYRGGKIYVPSGHYILSSTLSFTAYIAGDVQSIIFEGDGPDNTVLDFSGASAGTNGITFDTGAHIVVRDIAIANAKQDGLYLGSGNTIGGASYCSLFTIDNVRIQNSGRHGFHMTNTFMGSIRGVWSTGNTGNGFQYDGYHTSINTSACWASNNSGVGWSLNGMTYSDFTGCGADSNSYQGYVGSNLVGVNFINCGAESNQRDGFLFNTSSASSAGLPLPANDIRGVNLMGCFGLNNSAVSAGEFSTFLACLTANSRPITLNVHGGLGYPATTSDVAFVLNGASGTVTVQKEAFDASNFTAADVKSGSFEVTDLTVLGLIALVQLGSAQSIPNNTLTVVTWSATFVSNSLGATMAGNGIVIPKGVNRIKITANLDYASNTTGVRQLLIQKNSANAVGLPGVSVNAASAGDTLVCAASTVMPVSPGDVITVQAYQNSGGALNVSNTVYSWLSVEAMG